MTASVMMTRSSCRDGLHSSIEAVPAPPPSPRSRDGGGEVSSPHCDVLEPDSGSWGRFRQASSVVVGDEFMMKTVLSCWICCYEKIFGGGGGGGGISGF